MEKELKGNKLHNSLGYHGKLKLVKGQNGIVCNCFNIR